MTLAAAALAALLAAGGGGTSKSPTSEAPKGSLYVAIKVLKQGKQVIARRPGQDRRQWSVHLRARHGRVDIARGLAVARELGVRTTGTRQRIAGVGTVTQVASIKVKRLERRQA